MGHQFPAVGKVQERWRELASRFCELSDASATWSKASEDLLLAQIEGQRPRRILDLACGVGDPALRLARQYPEARVTGLDFVPAMTEEAVRRARAAGLRNLDVVAHDMLETPFEDGAFDLVTCRFGIQYYDDAIKRKVLREAFRVLSPQGSIALVDWGVEGHGTLKAFYMDVFSQYPETAHANDAATRFELLDDASFAQLVREAGFEDVAHGYPEVQWRWPGSPAELWEVVSALAPQLTELRKSHLEPSFALDIDRQIVANLERYARGEEVVLPVRHVVVRGRKP